jgi:SPP1 gp7 family putative phage head morphogenesis protein
MARKKNITADPEQFEEAVDAFRKRVPMKRGEWDKLTAQERKHAFMVSEVASADLVTEVYEAIDKAIAKGTTFAEFQKDIGGKLVEHWGGEKPGRIETIFRTNVLENYNVGRQEIFDEPAVKATRPYLRFDGIDDDRQSEICEEYDGMILPTDDPFWARHSPPLHYNCRSTITALSEEEADEEGITTAGARPKVPPLEGFGQKAATSGKDWVPDVDVYPAEIAAELKKRGVG